MALKAVLVLTKHRFFLTLLDGKGGTKMPYVKPGEIFYGEIAAEVVREDWRKRKNKYPSIYTGRNLAKWLNYAERTVSEKISNNKVLWNITFDDLYRYADAVGLKHSDLIELIDTKIKEHDLVDETSRENRDVQIMKSILDMHNK